MAIKNKTTGKFYQFLQSWKQGLKDISDVLQEGNFRLFVKQFVVILIGFFILRWGTGKIDESTKKVREQIDAIRVQQSSEQDYLSNKRKLLSLEPQFPDMAAKDQWLIQQLLEIFSPLKVTANMNDPQTENVSNPNYTIASKKVGFTMGFPEFGKLLADIENRSSYLRVSEFSIVKNTDANEIGTNTINMVFNTIFPKEKLAPVLFKDYKGGKK